MLTTEKHEPVRLPEFRICNSETMQNKLLYQIRTGNASVSELNRLQPQCTEELHQLRAELDMLLQELREIVDPSSGYKHRKSIAA